MKKEKNEYEYTFYFLGYDKIWWTQKYFGDNNSEIIDGRGRGHRADVIVINTCCFVHDAKESIQNILETEYKKRIKSP